MADYWEMDMLTDFFTEHLRMRVCCVVAVWFVGTHLLDFSLPACPPVCLFRESLAHRMLCAAMTHDFLVTCVSMMPQARRADTPQSVWDAFHSDHEKQAKLVAATLARGEGFTPHAMREAV